jgi:hypothetical protein
MNPVRPAGLAAIDGFEGQIAVLHPLAGGVGATTPVVPWSSVAAHKGIGLTPHTEWAELAARDGSEPEAEMDEPWDGSPSMGSLPRLQLAAIVSSITQTDPNQRSCWIGVWYGWSELRSNYLDAPNIEIRRRSLRIWHLLMTELASLDLISSRWQSPTIWWAEDHSWAVTTEVDDYKTYVSGSSELIESVSRNEYLETMHLVDPL